MTEFEKAVSEKEEKYFTGEIEQENVVEFLRDAKTATVSFSQGRYIGKIKKLAEQYPEDVQIIHENRGSIVAHIPVSYVRIGKPKQMNLTDEQKEILRERGRNALQTFRNNT